MKDDHSTDWFLSPPMMGFDCWMHLCVWAGGCLEWIIGNGLWIPNDPGTAQNDPIGSTCTVIMISNYHDGGAVIQLAAAAAAAAGGGSARSGRQMALGSIPPGCWLCGEVRHNVRLVVSR